jgi:hypothetical protein
MERNMSSAASRLVAGEVFSPAAFTFRNLSVLAYAQGFTLWHYKAPAQTLHAVTAPGYFNHASDMLAAGDILLISASDGGASKVVASTTLNRVMLGGVA